MAAAKKRGTKVRKKDRKSSFFCFSLGGCFGISIKVSADHHGDGKSAKDGKTVPVNDQTTASSDQIICSSREIHVVEAGEEETKVIDDKAHGMILERSQNSYASGQVKSSTKQMDKRNSIAQEILGNPTKLSHSVSLPLPQQKKEKLAAPAVEDGRGHKDKKGKELIVPAGEFESMLGASIIMVTLIVMLIWGKVCAILCTAAWFYFIPRLRANINESYAMKLTNGINHVDLDSREYKKKVVLQGLLERNQHV